MKAYRGADDKIRMFRPMHNMARMVASAQRACLPIFDGGELVQCMRKYVEYPSSIRLIHKYFVMFVAFLVNVNIFKIAIFQLTRYLLTDLSK